MKKQYFVIGLIAVVVIAAAVVYLNQTKQAPSIPRELSFTDLYCGDFVCNNNIDENGSLARDENGSIIRVSGKDECEKKDVSIVVNKRFVGRGQDGIPDCSWKEYICMATEMHKKACGEN